MVVGCARISLHVPAAQSLKEKRAILQRIKARVRQRFNVSIAEIDHHDAWGTVTLAVATVTNDAARAHSVLEKVVRAIETDRPDLELFDYSIEMF